MKQLTLRLNDQEAAALERMAVVEDTSQNEILKRIIGDYYCSFYDDYADQSPITNDLNCISESLEFFWYFLRVLTNTPEVAEDPGEEDTEAEVKRTILTIKDLETLKMIYRAAKYSLDRADEDIEGLEAVYNAEQIEKMKKGLENTMEFIDEEAIYDLDLSPSRIRKGQQKEEQEI